MRSLLVSYPRARAIFIPITKNRGAMAVPSVRLMLPPAGDAIVAKIHTSTITIVRSSARQEFDTRQFPCTRLEDASSTAVIRCTMAPNTGGWNRGRRDGGKSPYAQLAQQRSEVMDGLMVSCHPLRDRGLGGFRRTGKGNDEGGAAIGFAIHRQRAVMPFDDRLRHTEP
jgi:hypothetical protein